MKRPETTLFMLMSVDGKISTGIGNNLDFDKDLPSIDGVKEGLNQYYEIEQTTDLWSVTSGAIWNKLGANNGGYIRKTEISFVVFDSTHLTEAGVQYLCNKTKELVIVTSNNKHPAFKVLENNLHIILQSDGVNIREAFEILYNRYGCKRLTVQTGGTLNTLMVRAGLIDNIDIVIAPILIGGAKVPTLMDGISILESNEFHKFGILRLKSIDILKENYIRIKYTVLNRKE